MMIKLYYKEKQVIAIADENCAVYFSPDLPIIEKEFATQEEVAEFVAANGLTELEGLGVGIIEDSKTFSP